MKNWRPDGWKTLKPKYYPLHCLAADDCVAQSFEAGADAMLEALREMGEVETRMTYKSSDTLRVWGKETTGKSVFIPDEEAKE